MLVRLAPDVAAVRELYGLTLYRLGRWREAVREFRAPFTISQARSTSIRLSRTANGRSGTTRQS